jgi:uncharacterized membrane protein
MTVSATGRIFLRHTVCATFALVSAGLATLSHAVAASDLQPKRLAIIVKSTLGASARPVPSGPRAIAARLKYLGYAFLETHGDKCEANDRDLVELEPAQLESAIGCLETVTSLAEIVVFYYAGPIGSIDGVNHLILSPETGGRRLVLPDLLQAVAAKSAFVSVLIVDAAESPSTNPDAHAQQKYERVVTPGTRRILAYSAPIGETSEPSTRRMGSYTFRLLPLLDGEIGKMRSGAPLTDLRDLLRNKSLVTSSARPGRSSEVLAEGLGVDPVTFAGRAPSPTASGVSPTRSSAESEPPNCGLAYLRVARGAKCPDVFEFQKRCRDPHHAALATMALRLRCADELLERKYKMLQETFGKAEQRNSCAAWTQFLEETTRDFELADAPEIEKANTLRGKRCEQEARERELADLEVSLRSALSENDCATFRRFERENGVRLSPAQSDRLTSALKQRCEQEEKATSRLRSCLDRVENEGNFCGAAACFSAFRGALPQDAYFVPHRAESQRQEKICREAVGMRTCFSNDECGGERCSLPLRLAVGNGPLISYIQKVEQEAGRQCTAKKEREQQAAIDAEREQQRRAEELRAQARRDATFKLTVCNRSTHPKIWITLSYYDYDEKDWIVEGWWAVNRGNCDYIGDRFRRGTFYYYAHAPGEKYVWAGDFGLCVRWTRFRRVNTGGFKCGSSEHRKFRTHDTRSDEYTLGLR